MSIFVCTVAYTEHVHIRWHPDTDDGRSPCCSRRGGETHRSGGRARHGTEHGTLNPTIAWRARPRVKPTLALHCPTHRGAPARARVPTRHSLAIPSTRRSRLTGRFARLWLCGVRTVACDRRLSAFQIQFACLVHFYHRSDVHVPSKRHNACGSSACTASPAVDSCHATLSCGCFKVRPPRRAWP
jgi:hypothetical protein